MVRRRPESSPRSAVTTRATWRSLRDVAIAPMLVDDLSSGMRTARQPALHEARIGAVGGPIDRELSHKDACVTEHKHHRSHSVEHCHMHEHDLSTGDGWTEAMQNHEVVRPQSHIAVGVAWEG